MGQTAVIAVRGAVLVAFAIACLLVYAGMREASEAAKGTNRFLLIGLARSILLAFGVVGLMLGLSSFLAPISR